MPATATELFKSREGADGPNEDTERIYQLEGSDDDVELKTALRAAAPSTVTSVDGVEMERDGGSIEQIGTELWIGRYRYAKNATTLTQFPPAGSVSLSFDTAGGSQHITHSRRTAHSYAATGTPVDYKNAIGVEDNGGELTIAGCDIEVPVYNWEETHILSGDDVTESYRVTIALLTGAVNSSSFRGFAAGEVLFRGARGSRRSDGDWEIAFAFSALPNVSGGQLLGEDFKVGDITITTKKGWDYVWIKFKNDPQTIDGTLYQRPKPEFAYVEVVRPYANLDQLNLPDPN